MWYDNECTHLRGSTTVFTDECGITHVKAIAMPYQEKEIFYLFVMLECTIYVFYIKDKLHAGCLLVHEAAARAQPVIYKFPQESRAKSSGPSFVVGNLEEEEGFVEVNEVADEEQEMEDDLRDEGSSEEEQDDPTRTR